MNRFSVRLRDERTGSVWCQEEGAEVPSDTFMLEVKETIEEFARSVRQYHAPGTLRIEIEETTHG